MANALRKAMRSLAAKAQGNAIKLTTARRPLWMETKGPTEVEFRRALAVVDGIASGLTARDVQPDLRWSLAATKRLVLAIQEMAKAKPLNPASPKFEGLPEQAQEVLTEVFSRAQRHLRSVEDGAWFAMRQALDACEGLHAPRRGWAEKDFEALREGLKGADLGISASPLRGEGRIRLNWRTKDKVDLTPWVTPALALAALLNECSRPRKRLGPKADPIDLGEPGGPPVDVGTQDLGSDANEEALADEPCGSSANF